MKSLEDYLIASDATLRDALACIDRNASGIALVVAPDRKLLYTLTDGDTRRAILQGGSLDTTVASVKQDAKPPITGPADTDDAQALVIIQEHSIRHLPLVDVDGVVVDLVLADRLITDSTLPVEAVIMAGGQGTRLRPLTDNLPKPMLQVGDRPLLEIIVDRFRSSGVKRVHIATHYLPEKITEHFGDGAAFGVDISYVKEDNPLGTAGALRLVQRTSEPLLVINGDILTKLDFRSMLKFHRVQGAALTIAVRNVDLPIPYGVVDCDGPLVRELREKPTWRFMANAGIYLINPETLDLIPPETRFDMTDLIDVLLKQNQPVASFPIVEYWLDIGRHSDYAQAIEDVKGGRWAA